MSYLRAVPLLLLLLFPAACQKPDPAAKAPAAKESRDPNVVKVSSEMMAGIKVAPVGKAKISEPFRIASQITLDQDLVARIGVLVTGRISDIRVKVGQRVERGQLLATINSTELAAAQRARMAETTAKTVRLEALAAHQAEASRVIEAQEAIAGRLAREIAALSALIDPAEARVAELEAQQRQLETTERNLREQLRHAQMRQSQADLALQRAHDELSHLRTEIEKDLGLVELTKALDDEEAGRLSEAREKYEKILAAAPDHMEALVNLGNILYLSGHETAAASRYLQALGINPDNVEANYNLANLMEGQGELDAAILFYQKAIEVDPEFADAHFNLAMVLETLGNAGRAREHWRRYLELDPESKWAEIIKRRLEEI